MEGNFYVYIVSNTYRRPLYTGITANLKKRIFDHKNRLMTGPNGRYRLNTLLYFEHHSSAEQAIRRENQIKKQSKLERTRMIESLNPEWADLRLP